MRTAALSPSISRTSPGKDKESNWLPAFTDSEGKPLDGSKTYKMHLPPNIPAKNFWSFVVYDNQTRSMLQTDQQFPSIGSQKKGIVINPDTSVDIWFGQTAPSGHEANWVQTVPGKGWNVILPSTVRSSRGSTRPGSRESLSWCELRFVRKQDLSLRLPPSR